MISYEPLYKTMKKQNVTTYTLIYKHDINARTIHNIKNNKGISTYTIERLCKILKCTPNDIFEFIDDDSE
ncbi:helix-turn-helix domain-containing protein [Candidatus Stoquefichus sp. SB1]|uniref:helix-turn-helix domain-containing protein n=1 Tax=Candidatus Stoquefichus sp. SB1 TaxID=1658109 RepID=UPI00067E6689|nr:helix-turn-helix transcriptional regulator [Candidatus Stoquefichus sp. SB1]